MSRPVGTIQHSDAVPEERLLRRINDKPTPTIGRHYAATPASTPHRPHGLEGWRGQGTVTDPPAGSPRVLRQYSSKHSPFTKTALRTSHSNRLPEPVIREPLLVPQDYGIVSPILTTKAKFSKAKTATTIGFPVKLVA